MIVHDCDQYSPEWWDARRGVPSASVANKIVTPSGALSTQSNGLINELIADSLGLADPPTEPNEWMIRGLEMEAEARKFFIFETGMPVEKVGFVTNDEGTAGCSPDGLVGRFLKGGAYVAGFRGGYVNPKDSTQAGLEIKCPKPSTHIGYLRDRENLPSAYAPQVHWSLAVTGLPRWYFLSYHPELDPVLIVVEPDEFTKKMAKAIRGFVSQYRQAKSLIFNEVMK